MIGFFAFVFRRIEFPHFWARRFLKKRLSHSAGGVITARSLFFREITERYITTFILRGRSPRILHLRITHF